MSKMFVTAAVLSALMFTTHLAAADDDFLPGAKSRSTAFALSAGGTAFSIGLVALGEGTHNSTLVGAGLLSSLVTPAAGEIYAGNSFTPWGTGLRLGSAALASAGVVAELGCVLKNQGCNVSTTLISVGAIGYVGGIVYDIVTAGTVADEYNEKHHLHVEPTVMRASSSGATVGVSIGGSF